MKLLQNIFYKRKKCGSQKKVGIWGQEGRSQPNRGNVSEKKAEKDPILLHLYFNFIYNYLLTKYFIFTPLHLDVCECFHHATNRHIQQILSLKWVPFMKSAYLVTKKKKLLNGCIDGMLSKIEMSLL